MVAFIPGEEKRLIRLIYDLSLAPFPVELVVSGIQSFKEFHKSLDSESTLIFNDFLMKEGNRFEYVESEKGRANQFNAGVLRASSHYVWLLHVDSRLIPSVWTDVSLAIAKYFNEPDRAFYFKLKFFEGPVFLKWNASWGNWRANFLGMIYGDQGFLMQRNAFLALNGFRKDLSYGEDHEFVWRSKRSSVIWKELDSFLETSGRAYKRKWLFKSLERIFYGFKQMLPLFLRSVLSLPKDFPMESLRPFEIVPERKSIGSRTAIVVFVKTPGHSNLKTRLGEGIGKEKAENFHLLSCKKIESTLLKAKSQFAYHVFWGVAESEALNAGVWNRFPRLLQSEGGLGDRLAAMYHQLYEDFDNVLFIGSDCPQLTIEDLNKAVRSLNQGKSFYLGLSDDGGYYLFGGNRHVPKDLWLKVPYSVDNTAKVFSEELGRIGELATSEVVYSDVDTEEEYNKVIGDLYFSEEADIPLESKSPAH